MGLVLVPHEQRESCQLLVRVCARLGRIFVINRDDAGGNASSSRVVPINVATMQVMPGDKEQVSRMLMSVT